MDRPKKEFDGHGAKAFSAKYSGDPIVILENK